jgi:hypothetical protein
LGAAGEPEFKLAKTRIKVRPGCFPLYIELYTFNIITFLNQQVESFKEHL